MSKLKFNAKYLLALSAVIASASIYFGNQWSAEADILISAAPKFEKEANQSKALFERVSSNIKSDNGDAAKSLNETSAVFLTELRKNALKHAVHINQLTISSSVSSESIDVNSLAKAVGNSQLKAVTYKITATYLSYEEFKNFLTQFNTLPVAVTAITMQGSTVEADFTIYGT